MLQKNKLTIILFLLLACVIAWMITKQKPEQKNGFVIIQEVYNGFDLKKENEKKFLLVKNARDKILDSLQLELKILADRIESEKEKNQSTIDQFTSKRDEFVTRKKNYEEDNDALSKKFDKEIFTQLNQYVKDFGDKNGYTYVFGNDGNGSLMYANETKNITAEVIEFINKKYRGE